jgi:hypothetical protein
MLAASLTISTWQNYDSRKGVIGMRRGFALIIVTVLSLVFGAGAFAPTVDRSNLEKEIEAMYAQIREKEKLLIAPAAEDQAKFAEFLSPPETGIFRLMPREKYDGKLSVRGGGAYYSFTRLTHEYGYGSDIELSRGSFSVGFAGYDFGFITILGDVPLESVTLNHPAIKFHLEYVLPTKEPDIRAQQRQSHNGYKVGEFTYTRNAVASLHTTYLLRSIDYSGGDILVALRVIRRDADGSVVLLWKKLKVFPAPMAER